MRRASARRAAQHRKRIAMLRRTTHGPVRCTWPGGCVREGVDAHELLSRARGGSITDPDNIVILCREHHDWITVHPAAAANLGLSLSAYPLSDNARIVRRMSDTTAPDQPPTPTGRRRRISVRITDGGGDVIDRLQRDATAGESTVVRAMLAVAARHEAEVLTHLRGLDAR